MRVPDNSNIVIFGASGDLSFRKLIPALFHLYVTRQLPDCFFILGVSRSAYDSDSYREALLKSLSEGANLDSHTVEDFLQHVYYLSLNTSDVTEYSKLKLTLNELYARYQTPHNTLFYMAMPPSMFTVIPDCLSKSQLLDQGEGWKRIVVEKPLGYDLESAIELDHGLHSYFDESQIYRIDHYLGKETVQNLLVFRFANGMFEPLWDRNYIDYVEITGAEKLGVESRGSYYDGAGAVRDMFQNHLLQVLAMVAMEPPAVINADSTRNEVVKVLQSLKPLSQADLENNLVLGQYTESLVKGSAVPGYRDEEGVSPDSRTETYVALKLFINNWRWNGVPFYIRTGKSLPTRVTEVVIHFKHTPHPVFGLNAPANKLVIRIQPDEGIVMQFGLKKPGAGFESKEVSMDFRYQDLLDEEGDGVRILNAYERLLLDALNGDATLFARSDAVQSCWQFVEPILKYQAGDHALHGYASGTWGPKEAESLLRRDGRTWRFPCKNLANTHYCEL
jgi:glucose-6-phosphate 1-dehydrogenase